MGINPRWFVQDYPPAIQAMVPPKTVEERRLGTVWGLPFLLLLLAGPLWSTWGLHRQLGAASSFLALFGNAAGIALVFNVVDWLVLDWLLFCTWTPRFMVIPGSEGSPAYKDYAFHFRGFLIGCLFSGIGGLAIAALVWLAA